LRSLPLVDHEKVRSKKVVLQQTTVGNVTKLVEAGELNLSSANVKIEIKNLE